MKSSTKWTRTSLSSTYSAAVSKAGPPVVAVFCGYEVIAIASGRIPTISALDQRFHVLGPLILGALFAHFYGRYLQRYRQRGAYPSPQQVSHGALPS
jgi:hypothetical protein